MILAEEQFVNKSDTRSISGYPVSFSRSVLDDNIMLWIRVFQFL